jgi:hypothetical protein
MTLSLLSQVHKQEKNTRFQGHMVVETLIMLAESVNTTPDVLVEGIEHVLAHLENRVQSGSEIDAMSRASATDFLAGTAAILKNVQRAKDQQREKMLRVLLGCRFEGEHINSACVALINYGAQNDDVVQQLAPVVDAYYNNPADKNAAQQLLSTIAMLRKNVQRAVQAGTQGLPQ